MPRFSVRPVLTLRGRTFKGLRGFSGKPFHPPLTDFPIAAYIFGCAFDVIAVIGRNHSWAREFFHAGTYTFVAGAAVSVLAALTGFWDWLRSTEAGTQARRTANTHALIMVFVTVMALCDIALRLSTYHTRACPNAVTLALSVAIAAFVALGATFGGSLVFDYGFNVETAGDSPVWHHSDRDIAPDEPHKAA